MGGLGAQAEITGEVPVRTDQELVADVRAGDSAAFGELAGRYRRRIESLCRRFFSDPELVRDLTQECFLRAFAGLDSYRCEMPFATWIRTIAVNASYDELRRRRRRPEELVADFTSAEAQWGELLNHASPEELTGIAEERRGAYELAHRLLNSLRPEDRLVLVLRDGEEMGVNEIAQTLGWSEAKVKIRAFRARQALRKQAKRVIGSRRFGFLA
ncbi:MAG: sigma-70 family RNA polymerase sigma factor [Candidatus Binataceae bacterium]|nr:sigma-70 family RNA polymerase sigma factor [Candidatus Binataceae bacterium]